MADPALNRLASAPGGNERLAFLDAPHWRVGGERGMIVTQSLGCFGIIWYLDDAIACGLGLVSFQFQEQARCDPRLWHGLCLDNLDPRRPWNRAEIFRRGPDLVISHGFREPSHPFRVCLSWLRAISDSVLEIHHLLHEVLDRQARDARIFGSALAIGVMAESACEHIRLFAMRHDGAHRAVIGGMPVGGAKGVTDLRQSKRQVAARHVL